MAAFFPGAGRPEHLTPTQREMYLSQLGQVLFLRDRALLLYHFSKYGDEAVADLLKPRVETGKPSDRDRAWNVFVQEYGLNVARGIDQDTAREFLAALKAGRVPDWVLAIAPIPEIRGAAK